MSSLIKYLGVCLLITISLSSCKNFLNQEPTDTISNEDALSSYENVTYALNGTYSLLCGQTYYYSRYMSTYADVTGGNAEPPEYNLDDSYEYSYLYNFEMTAEQDALDDVYFEIYEIIYAANQVIEAAPALTDATDAQKSNLIGQATALRALCHFDLLRLFAQNYAYTDDASHLGIVLRLKVNELDVESARNTVAECYEAIVDDLVYAASLLDDMSDINYFCKQSAQALLARVYLYQSNWTEAAALANEVITSGVQSLAPTADYAEMWANDYESAEYLFRADASAGTATTLSGIIGNNPSSTTKLIVSDDLISLYDDNDVRGTNTMIMQDEDDFWVSMKYPYVSSTKNDVGILRLSEVYLIRAEAYARLSRETAAQKDLNTIRQRAWPDATDVTATGDELLEEILRERRKELALEGHQLFDLTRNEEGVYRPDCNSTLYTCDLDYPNTKFVMPIPMNAIYANNLLEQNENY